MTFWSGNSYVNFYISLDEHWPQSPIWVNFITGKGQLSPLFPSCWEAFYFLNGDFHSTVPGGKKGLCRFQELKAGLPLLLQIHNENENIFHSCYMQIQQMSFKLAISLSTAWYILVNAVFSSITVSFVQKPEGSLMNPSCVAGTSRDSETKDCITTCNKATFLEMISNSEHIRVQKVLSGDHKGNWFSLHFWVSDSLPCYTQE